MITLFFQVMPIQEGKGKIRIGFTEFQGGVIKITQAS